jgi:hypothetical protein
MPGESTRGPASNVKGVAQGYPKISATRADATTAAVLNKLVRSTQAGINDNPSSKMREPSSNVMQDRVATTATNIADSENMRQMLPDIELAEQVQIASILSPNDMTSSELTYASHSDELGELTGPMVKIVRDYFQDDYKIKKILPDILKKVLFTEGAYPLCILPESSIDDAINSNSRVSFESVADQFEVNGSPQYYGIIGNNDARHTTKPTTGFHQSISTESYIRQVQREEWSPHVGLEAFHLDVVDNPNLLKYPMLREKTIQDRIQDIYESKQMGVSAQRAGMVDSTDNKAIGSLYRPRSFGYTPVLQMRTLSSLDKATVGHPLVLTLPTECVIPVHVPSNPEDHVGYFVAVDKAGNPIKSNMTKDFYSDARKNAASYKDMSSQLMATARKGQEGSHQTDEVEIQEELAIYTDVVERDLNERLKNGVYGDGVSISRPQEIYRIMFARACMGMHTQLLYIPTSLMTYIAFDYNEHGVGKSLLEATKIIGAIRVMLLFADTMAAIKNSVQHVTLNIELDPKETDPGKIIEQMMHEYARSRFSTFPLGASSPQEVTNYLQNAGVQMAVTGHPGWPETKLSIEDRQTNHAQVNTELSESLKKRQMMGLGIPPEAIDLSMNVDFATSVVSSNILMAKRAKIYQEKLCLFLSDFMQKYICNSSILMDKFRTFVKANRSKLTAGGVNEKHGDDAIVYHFINSLNVSLPEPDLSKIEMQTTAFDNYNKLLEEVIPAYVSSDMFDASTLGGLSDSLPSCIAVIKAYFQRKWLHKNNVMPELFEISTFSEKGGAAFDLLKEHAAYLEGIEESLMDYLQKVLPQVKANQAKLDIANGNPPDGGDGGGGDGGEAPPDDGGETPPDDDFSSTDDETPPDDAAAPPDDNITDTSASVDDNTAKDDASATDDVTTGDDSKDDKSDDTAKTGF